MSRRRAKYKDLVDKVFNQPELFFRKGKIVRGWVIPEIDMRALEYHLGIGVGTAYTVRYGVNEKLKEIAKNRVEVVLKKSEEEGDVIIRLQQGKRWCEFGPFKAEEISGAASTPLLLQAAKCGFVIPVATNEEIRENIRLWAQKGKRDRNEQAPTA